MTGNTPHGFGTRGGEPGDARRATSSVRTDGGAVVESVTDPARLTKRDDVDYRERTFAHGTADHCEATAAGRAIVGVTNDRGEVLLWVRRDADHAILPNELVKEDEGWATAARRVVGDAIDASFSLDGVERVRAVDHVVETDDGDGERFQRRTHHVVFAASLADPSAETDPSIDECNDEWTARWYDALPAGVGADEGGDGDESESESENENGNEGGRSVHVDLRTFLE